MGRGEKASTANGEVSVPILQGMTLVQGLVYGDGKPEELRLRAVQKIAPSLAV